MIWIVLNVKNLDETNIHKIRNERMFKKVAHALYIEKLNEFPYLDDKQ